MKKMVFLGRAVLLGMCALPLVGGNVWAEPPSASYKVGSDAGSDEITTRLHVTQEDLKEHTDAANKAARKAVQKAKDRDDKEAKKMHQRAVKLEKDGFDMLASNIRTGAPTNPQEKTAYMNAAFNILLGRSAESVKRNLINDLSGGSRANKQAIKDAVERRIGQAYSSLAPGTNFFTRIPKAFSSDELSLTLSYAIAKTTDSQEPSGLKEFLPMAQKFLEINPKNLKTALQERVDDKICKRLGELFSYKEIKVNEGNRARIVRFTQTLAGDAKYRVQARIIKRLSEENISAFLALNASMSSSAGKKANETMKRG